MKKKTADILFILALCGMLAVCFAGIRRSQRTSFYENRTLAPAPAVTASAVWDGSFGEDLEAFLTDRAPWRLTMLKARTAADLALRRPVVNDIVVTKDLLLPFYDFDRDADEKALLDAAQKKIDRLERLSKKTESCGGTFLFVTLPTQTFYYANEYPSYLNDLSRYHNTLLPYYHASLSEKNISYLDMGLIAGQEGYPAMYSSRTDHHYSMEGALSVWKHIVETLQKQGADISFDEKYTLETLPNPYLGSRNRKLLGLRYNDEKLQRVRFEDPVSFERFNNGRQTDPILYKILPSRTDPVDYSYYMGGDIGEVVLKTHRPDKPKVLIFGESFVNAIETFAYVSCDEFRSIDLRHYKEMTLKKYIELYKPDIVIGLTDYSMMDQ